MKTICGADCSQCSFKDNCRGCEATGGKPFGGDCVAAMYIRCGGKEAYQAFKQGLLEEVNGYLTAEGIPAADRLCELPGEFVNLPYVLPSGEAIRFLDDSKVYLGCQIEFAEMGICYGAVADASFILICRYSVNGSEPEIVLFKKR